MNIEVEFIKKMDKVKMTVTFITSSLGCFTVDTDYKSAGEIFKQYEQIHNEFTVLGNIRLNENGVIIRSENG